MSAIGSRVMHYAICTLLEKELGIHDDAFLVGGLAPDAHQSKGEAKRVSHFMRMDEQGIAYIGHQAFYRKYLAGEQKPYHLGYYVHLVADHVWLSDVYFKRVKWLPPEIKPEAKKQYYRDFRRLNGKLIDHYSLELGKLQAAGAEVEEIDASLLPQLIRDLEGDFHHAPSVKEEALEILELDEVIRTIGKTAEVCSAALKKKEMV